MHINSEGLRSANPGGPSLFCGNCGTVIVGEQYLVIIARRIVENCARGRGLRFVARFCVMRSKPDGRDAGRGFKVANRSVLCGAALDA